MLKNGGKIHGVILLVYNGLRILRQAGNYGNCEPIDSQPISRNWNVRKSRRSDLAVRVLNSGSEKTG